MLKAGPPVTITATDTAQPLSTTVGLVKGVRIYAHWSGTNRIYIGDSTLKPSTNTGVIGWAPPPPTTPGSAPYIDAYETDSSNSINCKQLFVAGTQNDVILWSYIEQ